MTPAARINAAIELLDYIQSGELADKAIAHWGRNNRYAGSKDRAAIRDIIYDVLRNKLSYANAGGGQTGRALALGYLRVSGQDPETIFGVDRYAPYALEDYERTNSTTDTCAAEDTTDFPGWIWPELLRSHGDQAQEIAQALKSRAPVFLRVNLTKMSLEDAIRALSDEGITGQASALSPSAIEVLEGERKIRNSALYQNGEIELQDASSQAVADLVPLQEGQKLLDYCAGGGGKVLAVAGRVLGEFYAHDIDTRRMKDLPPRAARAGTSVTQVATDDLDQGSQFDTILVDAPCSGSGSWRRDPQGKWMLTQEKLDEVIQIQQGILDQVAPMVKPQGHLVYATCSLFQCENDEQTRKFLAQNTNFSLVTDHHFTPLDGGDGFYCAVLARA